MVYNQPYFISLRGDGPEFRGIASTMTGDGKHKPPIYGKMVKSWTWGLHRLNSCWSGRKFQRSYHFRDDFGYFHLIAIPDSRARMTIFFLDAANCNCYGQWMGGCAVGWRSIPPIRSLLGLESHTGGYEKMCHAWQSKLGTNDMFDGKSRNTNLHTSTVLQLMDVLLMYLDKQINRFKR